MMRSQKHAQCSINSGQLLCKYLDLATNFLPSCWIIRTNIYLNQPTTSFSLEYRSSSSSGRIKLICFTVPDCTSSGRIQTTASLQITDRQDPPTTNYVVQSPFHCSTEPSLVDTITHDLVQFPELRPLALVTCVQTLFEHWVWLGRLFYFRVFC